MDAFQKGLHDRQLCTGCAKHLDPLDAFPKGECLDCHKADPETEQMHATMTGEKLAKMWGA